MGAVAASLALALGVQRTDRGRSNAGGREARRYINRTTNSPSSTTISTRP